jgi:hypothetical protein
MQSRQPLEVAKPKNKTKKTFVVVIDISNHIDVAHDVFCKKCFLNI